MNNANRLYDDGLHHVATASRSYTLKGLRYGVWRDGDCRRGFASDGDAIEHARLLTKEHLMRDASIVARLLDEPAVGYGKPLKVQINKARRSLGLEPLAAKRAPKVKREKLAVPVCSQPRRRERREQFNRRGFVVAHHDGIFEYWSFQPAHKNPDRVIRPGKQKPAMLVPVGTIVLTLDDTPIRTKDGSVMTFSSQVYAEEHAETLIAAMDDDSYIRIRDTGQVYEDLDGWVILFRPGDDMTEAELAYGNDSSFLQPYTLWKRGGTGLLRCIAPVRTARSEGWTIRENEFARKRTLIADDDAPVTYLNVPARFPSMAVALQAIADIEAGKRKHGFFDPLIQKPLW